MTDTDGDHPRSRGVYGEAAAAAAAEWGSSPLARGLRVDDEIAEDRQGIIPARAGFTGRYSGLRRTAEDHPRSRGVYHPKNSVPD